MSGLEQSLTNRRKIVQGVFPSYVGGWGRAATSLHWGTPLTESSCAVISEIWQKVEKNDHFYKIGKEKFWNSTFILFFAHLEKSFSRMKL